MKTFPANLTKLQAQVLLDLIDQTIEKTDFFDKWKINNSDASDLYFVISDCFNAHETYEGLKD